ncbi:MAG: SLBB domain-containing protein, partial [Chloroflexi bacterium]|nr:SLBB domain-containing protein [Chloroflexota bacterium]
MPQMLLGLVTLAAIAGAVLLLVRSSSDGGIEIVLPEPTVTPVVELKAYISGAVRNPGVYDVNEGDRLVQLVEAAGGVTDDADLSAVNLAAKVRDEDHWHIPRPGETAAAGSPASPSAQRSPSVSGKIDINTA